MLTYPETITLRTTSGPRTGV